MRFAVLFAAALAGSSVMAATPSPEQDWKAGIDEANVGWAKAPHAVLKIQDSAYLADGDFATLVGRKGDPASWHWTHDKSGGALSISIHGGKLSVTKDGKAIDQAVAMKSIPIDTGVDVSGQPTQVQANVDGWRFFVFNQKNPDAANFTGVSYFPYNPAYRIDAKFAPDAKRPPHDFRTSRGTDKRFYRVGEATFNLQGKTVTLPLYAGSNDPKQIEDMSAFFTDDLTGKGAYGAGRYVDVADFGSYPPSTITIDFNDAYNPNCARSKHFTCPIAIDSIPLAMKAGEKDPHMAH